MENEQSPTEGLKIDDTVHEVFIGVDGVGVKKGDGLFKVDSTVDKPKHAGGRPSEYTQVKADLICEQLAIGSSLRTICNDENMPSIATVFKWMRTNEEFLKQYARAKQESADAMAEEVLDISDNGSNDWMERNYGESTVWVTNGEALQRSKLRVDTRKWLMSKMKPKKYGEKMDVTSDGKAIKGNTIVFSDFKADETES